MKFSFNWLKELSGTKKSAEEVAELLTRKSFEVEDVTDLSAGLGKVVVGEVFSVEKHPNADRLRVASVDVGDERLQIVCGAPNLAAGQKVPVALVGAELPTSEGETFKIKKSKIRGVESRGMICAEDELGLGDDHEGIMVLSSDAPVGESFARYLRLDDKVLNIDILPNRAHDCLSHIGVAREICASEGRVFREPEIVESENFETNNEITATIKTEKCLRYAAVMLESADNAVRIPTVLTSRLRACGLRAINPAVDITNYVMLLTGQPLHVFDADKINSREISVRQAEPGEKMILLDGREIELNAEDIVIVDGDDKVIALAGVMGGLESAVTTETTSIVLEAAAFDPVCVRRTRVRHGIVSDAAYRFEREISPVTVDKARASAAKLFREICGARVTAATDQYPQPVKVRQIFLRSEEVERLLGEKIPKAKVFAALRTLGVEVSEKDKSWECSVPPERLDLRIPEDLIEEVGRLYGYENIAPQSLQAAVSPAPTNELRLLEHRLRDLSGALGADEIKTYSFYGEKTATVLGLEAAKHLKLANPMNPEQTLMRRTLTGHVLQSLAVNLSFDSQVCVFELGKTYLPDDNEDTLCRENPVLALGAVSRQNDARQFFLLKGILQKLLPAVGLIDWQIVPLPRSVGDEVEYHPSRRAMIVVSDGTIIGCLGEATKEQLKYFGIKKARAATAEINVVLLQKFISKNIRFVPPKKLPSVKRDLSMTVPDRVLAAEVDKALRQAAEAEGNLLEDIRLFDVYVNPDTAERSLAFRLAFGCPERTLTSSEVDEVMEKIIRKVEEELKVRVRRS